jgi:sec-independent protein translocase protein TatB
VLFDIAPSEFLLTAVVAVVVIGPKDMPRAMRTMGKWMGTVRRVSGHFRSGIETMIREAEMEEMEKKWREQNEAIMKSTPPEALPSPELAAHAPTEPLSEQASGAELPVDPHSASAQAQVVHEQTAHEQAGHQQAKGE